jgi:hypothetical protein
MRVDLDVINLHDGLAHEFAADSKPALDALDGRIRQKGEYCKMPALLLGDRPVVPAVDIEGSLAGGPSPKFTGEWGRPDGGG